MDRIPVFEVKEIKPASKYSLFMFRFDAESLASVNTSKPLF
jgi:hypothetical protein